MSRPLTLGFMPLTDAAPLVVAAERGFFADEKLDVSLSREVSWATVRDKLAAGVLDGAHLLAPLALAVSRGVSGEPTSLWAPMALNRGGAAVTVSSSLAETLTALGGAGLGGLAQDREHSGAALPTFAVVFPYSLHSLLLRRWLADQALVPGRDVRVTVAPPSRMPDLLASGRIDGFCAGEPWNRAAEAAGSGVTIARAADLWPGALDKVLGVTRAWGEANEESLAGLCRALARAGYWADHPGHRDELAELLSRPEHVGAPAPLIAARLTDLRFSGEGVNAPDLEQAVRLAREMVKAGQLPDSADLEAQAAAVFRPDLLARALAG